MTQRRITSRNIVGRILGRSRPDETVIYTAHWDHLGVGAPDASGDRIYNGAVDNALGSAGLLEIARAWAAAPPPERTVVFLSLTSEEKGLLGAKYYVRHPLYPLATTAAVLNIDGGNIYGPSKDIAIAGDGKVTLRSDLARVARLADRELSPAVATGSGAFFRSDHFPFARAGVPAISLLPGVDLLDGGIDAGAARWAAYTTWGYHQPDDEWSLNWNLTGAAMDFDLLSTLGRDVANSRRWPRWESGSEFRAIREASASERR